MLVTLNISSKIRNTEIQINVLGWLITLTDKEEKKKAPLQLSLGWVNQ